LVVLPLGLKLLLLPRLLLRLLRRRLLVRLLLLLLLRDLVILLWQWILCYVARFCLLDIISRFLSIRLPRVLILKIK
jgi:hypothetical protein